MKPQVCPGRDPEGDQGWSWDGVFEVSGSGQEEWGSHFLKKGLLVSKSGVWGGVISPSSGLFPSE